MYNYAQLDEQNICIGVSQLSGEVVASNMIPIENMDIEYYFYRLYDQQNNEWTNQKLVLNKEANAWELITIGS